MQHSSRTFRDLAGNERTSDSGYFILPMDRHSYPDYLADDMPHITQAELIADKCAEEIFCGMPFQTTRMLRQSTYSYWMPADAPYLDGTVTLTRIVINQPENRFMFEMQGPTAMAVLMSPMDGVEIEAWSFFDEVTDTGMDFQGRPTYFVRYAAGSVAPANFWVDLKVPAGWTGKKLDIGIVGHYTHHDEDRTDSFQEFIDSYPEWCHVTAWMSSYNGYEF